MTQPLSKALRERADKAMEQWNFADTQACGGHPDSKEPPAYWREIADAILILVVEARLASDALDARATTEAEWQDISTAPKDGTEVLGYFRHDDNSSFDCGPWTMAWRRYWQSSWDKSEVVEYMGDFGTDYMPLPAQPTHWMPLPRKPGKFSNN